MFVSTSRKIPFDYAETIRMPEWRESLAWPLSHARAFAAGRNRLRAFLSFVNQLDDEDHRRIVLLGGGRVLAVAGALSEAALCLQEEAEAGITLAGGPAEIALLRGERPAAESRSWQDNTPFKPMAAPRWTGLRRIARTASLNPLRRLPAALIAPTAMAISHNELLRDMSARSTERVGFLHAELLLLDARAQRQTADGNRKNDVSALAGKVADVLATVEGLTAPYAERLWALLLPTIESEFAKAADDLQALAGYPVLPQTLWSGTGGYYPARAIALEVRRRGGRVTRFSHGAIPVLVEVVEPTAFTELAVSDRFVVETQAGAAHLLATEARTLIRRCSTPVIEGGNGLPSLRRLPLYSSRTPMRRKAIYAPTILRGFRQFFPPLLPDVVYLDWQHRLVRLMQTMPVDLLCKPHPEGLLRGQPHPLAGIAPTTNRPFETVMEQADVFVFDYVQSTTFTEALCTDRPIVVVDMGNPLFSQKVRAMLERRCRIVRAQFDERNLPHVNASELQEAICSGSDRADPREFQALLMGTTEFPSS